MDTTMSSRVVFRVLLLMCLYRDVESECTFPEFYQGKWYHMEMGQSIETSISKTRWGEMQCLEGHTYPKQVAESRGSNMTLLVQDGDCYYCMDVLWRTPNILQTRRGDCLRERKYLFRLCLQSSVQNSQGTDWFQTYFRLMDAAIVNCASTFEGLYQFTYEVDQGEGTICDHPDSQIQACQEPGSQYVFDNDVFMMQYAKCKDVPTFRNMHVRYRCYGTWFAVRHGVGYTFAAVSDTVEKENRDRFKCLMTLKNQSDPENNNRWVMSRFADCETLNSIYNGPVRLVLTRMPPETPWSLGKPLLDRNTIGDWDSVDGQQTVKVSINGTHIIFSGPEGRDTYYSSQETEGNMYLMAKYTVGKCDTEFVCVEILNADDDSLKYRIGQSMKPDIELLHRPRFVEDTFGALCGDGKLTGEYQTMTRA